jgi:DNA ligase-1
LLAEVLSRMAPAEARVAVTWLSGELPQRQIGVGWAALRSIPAPADEASLSVLDVDERFSAIKAATGAGSQARRRDLLAGVFGAATAAEQAFLRGLLGGELRQGALSGVATDAIARATGVQVGDVRRAAMLGGDLGATAAMAMTDGAEGLAAVRLQVGRPVSPMLAQTATSVQDALDRIAAPAALEWKLDGARVQIHRSGSAVSIFTRSLDDVTARMPEVVQAVLALPVRELVADGEVVALRPDGRPQPFQLTASRVGTSRAGADAHEHTPLSAYLFDVLHLDGANLLDAPTAERLLALDEIVAPAHRIGRVITEDPLVAVEFLRDTVARGHEGVMVKSLTAPYEAGRRGAGWLKVKPVHTLDLVVLAVEWGSGRRKGWLSNIHLGARSGVHGDDFVMLGKTFKGMTDAMLAWQTEHFLALATGPTDQWVVPLRPEQVVEIAFDGVQRSSRYPGGVALRFARVLRYRDDKTRAEADTLDAVRAFLPS